MAQETSPDVLSLTVREFIAAVAGKTPTPGGGSVAAVVGSLGVALGEMALNFTRGKKKFAAHEDFYAQIAPRLEKARRMFQDLVADDISAYRYYQETNRLPEGSDRDRSLQVAMAAAIAVPREATKLCLAVLEMLQSLVDKCNPYIISDLVAGAALAAAAARLSDYNVRINVPQVSDAAAAEEIRQASAEDMARADRLAQEIEQASAKASP